jgi:ActR/RegA family two-component response regulator
LGSLTGQRILILEDEYFIASDMKRALEAHGAEVVGPVGTLDEALRLFVSDHIDRALIDVNLEGADSYPLVDAFMARSVPFLFLTGYDEWALPARYRACPRLSKPCPADRVVEALAALPDQQ